MNQASDSPKAVGQADQTLCWICNVNKADSGEHKTKRSDLLGVLGNPTQEAPFFYSDLHKINRPVKSLDAKILKSPVRICANCNNARTQPHDLAWEHMSDWLRKRPTPLKIGGLVRGDRIFHCNTTKQMRNVHLFFLKLFGCMLAEAEANGKKLPVDIAPFSRAILAEHFHRDVYLQFGKCDGTIGRSNLHCWTTQKGSVLAGWLYQLDTIAVSVVYAQSGKFEHPSDYWSPITGSNRFKVADFVYAKRAAEESALA